MSDMSNRLSAFYGLNKKSIGKVQVGNGLACYAWVTGKDNELVAASVMGSSVAIEGLWANVVMGYNIYLVPNENPEWSRTNRYASTHNNKYKRNAVVVPNSNYLSMIVVNHALEKFVPGSKYLYLPKLDEDLEDRVHERLKQICTIPVLKEWTSYLIKEGSGLESANINKDRLCGEMRQDVRDWLAQGLNVFFMKNDKNKWESVITEGLRMNKISIKNQNGSQDE